MRLTVPLNPESLAHWTALAAPAARGLKPASVTLPGDPRRYCVVGVEACAPCPGPGYVDVRLVELAPLPMGATSPWASGGASQG